jgi:hypothetical protein
MKWYYEGPVLTDMPTGRIGLYIQACGTISVDGDDSEVSELVAFDSKGDEMPLTNSEDETIVEWLLEQDFYESALGSEIDDVYERNGDR